MAKINKTKPVEELEKDVETEVEKNPDPIVHEPVEDREPIDIIITTDPNLPYTDKIWIRQYSYEVHGPKYKELATEFCTKKPRGKVGFYFQVPSSKIKVVEVRYREKQDADLHLDKQNPNAPIVEKVFVTDDKEKAAVLGRAKFDATVTVGRKK